MLPAWVVLLPAVASAIVVGGWIIWRRPAMALPVFVIGFAFHNAILMALIQSGAPVAAVRAIQVWKEAYLGLLAVRLIVDVRRSGGAPFLRRKVQEWRSLPRAFRVLDLAALAFAVVIVTYALVPTALLPEPAPTLAQRIISFRTLMLIPVLYLFGRLWPPVTALDRRVIPAAVVTTAAAVAVFGLVELWFIPSRVWIDWGILNFNAFQGFAYHGPGGLPANFFQSTSSGGLRRMVSTYLSPLGIAYTGLLVVPLAVTFALSIRRARWPWVAFALVVISIALSVTRLALICLAVESIVLAVVLRRRWAAAATGFALAAVVAGFLVYPSFGPIVSFNLADVRPPLGTKILTLIGGGQLPSSPPVEIGDLTTDMLNRMATSDASIQAHVASLRQGADFVVAHPLGIGLGASVPRFGTATGPGESGLFQIGAETGLPGLVLFLMLYGGLVLACLELAFRRSGDLSHSVLPIVVGVGGLALVPVVLTTQVWGDYSVTFLFWWAAGSAMTIATRDLGLPLTRHLNHTTDDPPSLAQQIGAAVLPT